MSEHLQASLMDLRNVLQLRLDNGLQVLACERHDSPTVTSMIWYRVGSRHEPPGGTGRSHFLEHMMFKGTQTYRKGEIDLITMKNGGANNAFTSHDYTAYYFCFAADRWEAALDIEADRMCHTIFDPDEFEAERGVIVEELKAGLDQPWGLLMQELSHRAYDRHPYRNPVIGWQEDVEAAALADMEEYYRQHYCPSNATLVLVGDFDSQATLDTVHARFSHIASGAPPAPSYESELAQESERRFHLAWDSDVPRVAIAYHAPAIAHRDSYALQVLAGILGEGKSSRLYQRLVEGDRATTFVSAEYGEAHDDTLFLIRAESRGTLPPAAIEAAIDDELDKIVREGVNDLELERARRQIEAHFVFSMERSLDQAILLGQIQSLAGLEYIAEYLEQILRVDSTRISAVCQRYLTARNRTVGWLSSDGTGRCEKESA